ncbi:HFL203Wp [Eremothecium sinecaudum]|uniref:Dynein light chain n=1 Tax=Eremothecium sinecaudum TaxID=45286 RepID=A0A0X8HUI7_9SACH|nr:HFL203Wp [Eremothecium sinecaudum]AMD21653.1 HFL203Wp [Eremothecium sinecaudum]
MSKPVVKASDISDALRDEILDISAQAVEQLQLEREIAAYIKKDLDVKHGHTWHVIAGKNFGSYVTHEKGHFIYFYIGPLAFLVFKTA